MFFFASVGYFKVLVHFFLAKSIFYVTLLTTAIKINKDILFLKNASVQHFSLTL